MEHLLYLRVVSSPCAYTALCESKSAQFPHLDSACSCQGLLLVPRGRKGMYHPSCPRFPCLHELTSLDSIVLHLISCSQAAVDSWLAVAVDIEQHSCPWVEPFASSSNYTEEVRMRRAESTHSPLCTPTLFPVAVAN